MVEVIVMTYNYMYNIYMIIMLHIPDEKQVYLLFNGL